MTHPISTCLWFDKEAAEAASFYKHIFPSYRQVSENPLAVVYEIFGRRFMHLNGGPGKPITPSISFFLHLPENVSLPLIWNALSEGGKVLMPLQEYPWSGMYGWCADKYGVNWQLMQSQDQNAKLVPSILFTHKNCGKAEEAIHFYSNLIDNSGVGQISRYEKGEPDIEGNIKYSEFTLNGSGFTAMESSHNHAFDFNEAVSFILTVDTQAEIDRYWEALTKDGQPGKCGWLTDRYGISWQLVPSVLSKLMTNPETAPKAAYAFLQMSKFVLADLPEPLN